MGEEEARSLRHNYIGTEHILVGLLREEHGLAARVLESHAVTVERVRTQVVGIVASGEVLSWGRSRSRAQAKQVLETALGEAHSLGHDYVATEHVPARTASR